MWTLSVDPDGPLQNVISYTSGPLIEFICLENENRKCSVLLALACRAAGAVFPFLSALSDHGLCVVVAWVL